MLRVKLEPTDAADALEAAAVSDVKLEAADALEEAAEVRRRQRLNSRWPYDGKGGDSFGTKGGSNDKGSVKGGDSFGTKGGSNDKGSGKGGDSFGKGWDEGFTAGKGEGKSNGWEEGWKAGRANLFSFYRKLSRLRRGLEQLEETMEQELR